MKKVELLSPAGGYETMVGAFNAGADAVYLGGSKFGARAYADNFELDEVLDAIVYAHLHGKKIYMTVNTLVKEREFGEVYDFLLPYAEKRLDGVIVQDLGVASLIRKEFPDIELHASTQMTVTGVYGASLLKKRGFTRVVPARELSLFEMSQIREKAGIEVEAFIHGAMCYCYSGMCLFSSVIGGRSGNRGRCAQPCRLFYSMEENKNRQEYLLSLKDMSTIRMIPELINAGIDSFKIEGRMKRAEYSAGVTALYRKYIDKYYADPSADFEVSKEDMEILSTLYQRTGISEGYYHRHNGRDMVTITSPSYNATSEKVLEDVRDKYLSGTLKHRCNLSCNLTAGQNARLSMALNIDGTKILSEATGQTVQLADKRPMDEDNIIKQLKKLGGTAYEADKIRVSIDDGGSGKGIFISVGELNSLRRSLTAKMDELVTRYYIRDKKSDTNVAIYDHPVCDHKNEEGTAPLHILVSKKEQLKEVISHINDTSVIKRVYVESNIYLSDDFDARGFTNNTEFYVALPYITRQESSSLDGSALDATTDLSLILDTLSERGFSGVLVRNLEELSFIRSKDVTCDVTFDYGIYCWNANSAKEFAQMIYDTDSGAESGKNIDRKIGFSAPYELSLFEARDMAEAVKKEVSYPISYNIYGYIPMMVSAGCVLNTTGNCSGQRFEICERETVLTDRLGNRLPVAVNCRRCLNVIYNALPTSLHKRFDKVNALFGSGLFDFLRIDFTIEDGARCKEVLSYYEGLVSGEGNENAEDVFSPESYTTGHFKRGVE